MLRFLSSSSFLFLAISISSIATADDVKLQGNWIVESAIEGGNATEKPVGDRVKIRDGTFAVTPKDAADALPMIYTIDTDTKPMTINLSVKDAFTIQGVFQVEGDVLTLVVPTEPTGKRPTSLDPDKDSSTMKLIFKRIQDDTDDE